MANQSLQEIKDRLNIADVIGGYIQIKKAGAAYKALCPFHHEKSGSLMISPQKQIWHCFGCGEGGDIFGFVMKYENVDFREALKILADKAGVQLPQYRPVNPQEQSEKDLLLRINSFAAKYYHELLVADSRGKQAMAYLLQRGLTRKTIDQWQIGYAPDGYHSLEAALAKKKVSAQDLVKAGVSVKNERGQIYDRFRGRVTFPIFDYFGNIAGFSARVLLDDGKSAKYINSPETAIYNKSKILFGLNFAKESIRKADEAVIVEGQMDCISVHQAGFANTVATSGTALTSLHLAALGRLTKNLKFCFDADSAGRAALQRAGELALRQGFRLKVVELRAVSGPAGVAADGLIPENRKMAKDPDELVKRSPGLWQKVVSEAVWFLDHYINLAAAGYPAGSLEQKHYLSQNVIPLLGHIADPLEQDHYIRQIVGRFGITEKVVRQQIKPVAQEAAAAEGPAARGSLLLEKEVLGGLLLLPEFFAAAKAGIIAQDFEHPEIGRLAADVLSEADVAGDPLAKEAVFMLESQLAELGGNQPALLREVTKSLALLKLTSLKKRQAEIQTEIKTAESAKNQSRLLQLNRQFAQISAERLKFEAML